MIRDILIELNATPKADNTINLGYQNGWTINFSDQYRKLKSLYLVKGTEYFKNIGRCNTECGFTVNDGVDEFNIVSFVDSSD